MVTRYDVISRKWLGHFSVKVQFFSTFFNNKSKSCGLNHAKCLFMCYFSSEAQKVAIFWGCNRFLILSKIQDGGQSGDHCWWRHRHPAAPPPIKYTFRSGRSKAFRNTATNQKLQGGGWGIPSTPLVSQCWYEFACTPEGSKLDETRTVHFVWLLNHHFVLRE